MSGLRLIFTALSMFVILGLYTSLYTQFDLNFFENREQQQEQSTSLDIVELNSEQKFLAQQIDRANYCDVTTDCVNAGVFCPLGCQNLVNRTQIDDVRLLISRFEQTCRLDCESVAIECSSGRCVVSDERQ